jgi:hypothetical protein
MPHVTMIHGIGNKPEPDLLLASWNDALADDAKSTGVDLPTDGVSTSMVYWADVMYDEPGRPEEAHEATGADVITSARDEDLRWTDDADDEGRAFVDALASQLGYDTRSPGEDDYEAPLDEQDGTFERIPVPWFIKRRLMKAFLRDVHHYLFNDISRPRDEVYRVRDEIRQRFVTTLQADAQANTGGPHIVLSHSMGTVIAYDCLKRVEACPTVDALLTIGSPLGLDEIQDKMQPEWTRTDGYPSNNVRSAWANVYDNLDVVAALDTKIANDFRREGDEVIADIDVRNQGAWRHNISEYLQREQLRDWLSGQLGFRQG